MNKVGAQGERYVVNLLESKGYVIMGTNIRIGRGEIDVVATKSNRTYFVEVKTASVLSDTHPGEQMTRHKCMMFERSSQLYAQRHAIKKYFLLLAYVWIDNGEVMKCLIHRYST